VEKLARAFGVPYYELFIPQTRRTQTIKKELDDLLADASRIKPSNIEDFLKALRAALKKLDRYGA
jgi:hypothetical protein